jgi:hypothetical protein
MALLNGDIVAGDDGEDADGACQQRDVRRGVLSKYHKYELLPSYHILTCYNLVEYIMLRCDRNKCVYFILIIYSMDIQDF